MSAAPDTVLEQSLLEWFDEHRTDDVALYDITRQAATELSAVLLARKHAAASGIERDHWEARRELVRRQVDSLDPRDRASLAAQQDAWADEIDALEARPLRPPA
ncbi:MAG: hypothetical protein LBK95_18420 [Bifidobacteriaceae bacterium]|jgi:hypothetical protein|nr:hypothetical protein [Bifidobacteriaceae bacterium]